MSSVATQIDAGRYQWITTPSQLKWSIKQANDYFLLRAEYDEGLQLYTPSLHSRFCTHFLLYLHAPSSQCQVSVCLNLTLSMVVQQLFLPSVFFAPTNRAESTVSKESRQWKDKILYDNDAISFLAPVHCSLFFCLLRVGYFSSLLVERIGRVLSSPSLHLGYQDRYSSHRRELF